MVRARRRRARRARAAAAPPRAGSRPTACARVRLLYLYPSEVRDPLVATMLELPTVVPYFDLSLQHADARAAAAHEAVGERRPVPRRDRRHPRAGARRRVPLVVHRRLPRRDRDASTTRCSRSSTPRRSTGPASSRSRPRTARRRRRSTARSTPSSSAERLRECEEVQDPITRGRARRARRSPRSRCSSTRSTIRRDGGTLDRPHPPRGARDRRRRARLHAELARVPGATRAHAHVTEAIGPDLTCAEQRRRGAR